MKVRLTDTFAPAASAALATCAIGLAARSSAAARLVHYFSCNFDEYASVLALSPAGLSTISVNPHKGALVHCPIPSDDTLPHAGPGAVITVLGKETSPTSGVQAIACVTFASVNGFYCTSPKTSGAAFVGDYGIVFTAPFASAYANDFPFVDVALMMTGECCTSSLRGIAISEQPKLPPGQAKALP
jgi:hypothetical protein